MVSLAISKLLLLLLLRICVGRRRAGGAGAGDGHTGILSLGGRVSVVDRVSWSGHAAQAACYSEEKRQSGTEVRGSGESGVETSDARIAHWRLGASWWGRGRLSRIYASDRMVVYIILEVLHEASGALPASRYELSIKRFSAAVLGRLQQRKAQDKGWQQPVVARRRKHPRLLSQTRSDVYLSQSPWLHIVCKASTSRL
jgi:hypothetical protein